MEQKLDELLANEISRQIKLLADCDPKSEEYVKITETLTKLYRLRLDEVKDGWEYADRFEKNELEKQNQIRDQKNQNIKFILEGAGIGLPLLFYNVWMNRGFKFEENGVLGSQVFKNLIRFFKPTRV